LKTQWVAKYLRLSRLCGTYFFLQIDTRRTRVNNVSNKQKIMSGVKRNDTMHENAYGF
jgi:hypothetical protein